MTSLDQHLYIANTMDETCSKKWGLRKGCLSSVRKSNFKPTTFNTDYYKHVEEKLQMVGELCKGVLIAAYSNAYGKAPEVCRIIHS